MRAILVDPAKRTLAEIRIDHPGDALGRVLICETTITPPGWLARFGRGERVAACPSSDDGAWRVDVPCCAGRVFRGKGVIIGGDVMSEWSDSLLEVSVAKQIVKWGEK